MRTILKSIVYVLLTTLMSLPNLASTKYELPADMRVIELSQKIALSQVGVLETGYNSGIMIEKYLASVGLSKGYSWCCSFQYYCFQQAALYLKSIVPIKRSGICQVVFPKQIRMGFHSNPTCPRCALFDKHFFDAAADHI
jgi:hypothetical protein